MSALFPTYSRFPLSFVRGEGVWLWDAGGRRYLDFTSGIAVCNLGHVHPKVKARVQEQLGKLWHTSNLFEQPLQEEVAAHLNRLSGMDAVFFCNSGAEANEGAIKLARRYAQVVQGREAGEVITFHQSFHGRTLATLTATGQDKVKHGFQPLPQGFKQVPYNDLAALEEAITPATCAVMLEVVQAEGGVHPADAEWLRGVRRLCDEHDLLLIVDEIQTGMGRLGSWFGFQAYGIEPDVITLAKGLGSGVPVGAVLGKAHTVPAFSPGSHGSTFGGTPLAMSAALATIQVMEEENIPARARRLGELLLRRLEEGLANCSRVSAIRGKGLLVGIQLTEPAEPFIRAAQEKGLLVLSAGPQVIRLLPPLVVEEEQIQEAVSVLAEVLQAD
ncbi:MAG: acetylornithine aminotransferase [Bacillus thermozeamaize]|uniref:Acetylornithine aminotransferase n=1 Tax=Bacillus thermozeamaize TaxID=230954 RepID=A0A1Y3PN97_9BACI|nr:MAG: acetylornithine aminotransferase [Bacillus thermozeamaize]